MQKSIRILAAAALIALGIWGWRVLFPSPESVIRSRLKNLAGIVSFEPKQGMISKGYNAQKLTDYFTPDVEIHVNVRAYSPQSFSGRDELIQAVLFAQSHLSDLKVEFLDINITLPPDKQSATANLTGKATVSGDRDFNVQELNFMLKKVDGKWLIYRVETVKTLSQRTSESRMLGRT